MNRKTFHSVTVWLPVFVILTALLACNIPQSVAPTSEVSGQNNLPTILPAATPTQPVRTEIPTSTPIVHTLMPGEPPASGIIEITDRDSSEYAAQHRANGGELFTTNLYERPFNANSMDTYFPDLDITRTRLSRDSQWVYVNIQLVGQNPSGGLPGDYGVELDLNVDGRGDVLLMAATPGASWSTDGVRVWQDGNQDVGAAYPIQSDAPVNGDGYETLVFDQGVGSDPDAAWARISPSDPNSVQIAFKRALISDDDHFTWGAWAINESMLNPAWFDYNDHFTAAEAGSPLSELTQYYPLKAFVEVDNTCRWAVGFTPTGSEPGICAVPATPTPIPPATIWGNVWIETEYVNGIFNGMHDKLYIGGSVRVRTGSCGSPGSTVATAATDGLHYSVTVVPGTYCVDVPTTPPGTDRSSGAVGVTLNAGDSAKVYIYFWDHSISP